MLKDVFGKKTKYFTLPAPPILTENELSVHGSSCPGCGARIDPHEWLEYFRVCPNCSYHKQLPAPERIALIADEGSFREINAELASQDILDFPGYKEKLAEVSQETGFNEAVVTGQATIEGLPFILGIMDSRFMMGSMSLVVGEKIIRAAEVALEQKIPLVLFTASGGARMQEGMVSLIQMARTSAVMNKLQEAGILSVVVLTDPTTGGVVASFASLADIIIAETGALVAFTGPRVIQQTIKQQLPEGFQRAEFLMGHGMIDILNKRHELRKTLAWLLECHRRN